jgi:5-formyltetrahydrofolate cyclo-ligase
VSEPNSKAKFQVRAIAKARLGGVTPQDAAAWSKAVCDHIMAWQAFERARTLMLFMPLAGEVDLRSLSEEAIRLGKVVCLPRTDWQSRALNPCRCRALGPDWLQARHGLLEPPAAAMALPISDLDLIVGARTGV